MRETHTIEKKVVNIKSSDKICSNYEADIIWNDEDNKENFGIQKLYWGIQGVAKNKETETLVYINMDKI